MAFAGGGTLVGSGNNAKVAVGLEETSYGTSAAAQMWPGYVNDLMVERVDSIHQTRGFNNKRSPAQFTKISTRYRVAMSGEVVNGVPLAMGLGYISGVSDPTISVLKGDSHTTPTKSYLPSWTLFRTYDEATDDDLSVLGWTIDRFSLSNELDGPLNFSLEGPAQGEATTAASPTETTNPLGSWNTTLSIDEGASTFSSGIAIDGLLGFSLNAGNNLETKNEGYTSGTIRQPIPLGYDGTLSFRRRYIDNDMWSDILDGTEHSFRLAITDGTVVINLDCNGCIDTRGSESAALDRQSENMGEFLVTDMTASVTDSVTYVGWD